MAGRQISGPVPSGGRHLPWVLAAIGQGTHPLPL